MVYDEVLLYHFPEKVESYNEAKLKFASEAKNSKKVLENKGYSSLSGGGETSSDSDFYFDALKF